MSSDTQPAQKVPLYSLPDLKSAVDDAIAPYLTSLPQPYRFSQDHTLSNIRLILGYCAVVIAGALFYLDYKFGWDVTKPYTLPACLTYFVLNGALTLWVYAVEGGNVFMGTRPGGQKIAIKSEVKKPKPIYFLYVTYSSPDGKTKWQDNVIHIPFSSLFNTHGFLQKQELRKWLAQQIDVVGRADPLSAKASGEIQHEVSKPGVVEVSSPTANQLIEPPSTERITRSRSKSPLPETLNSATPERRGAGRSKKNT